MNAKGRWTKAQPKCNAVVESCSPVKTVLYIVMQNIWLRLLIKNESSQKELLFFLLLATPTSQVQPVALKTDWGSCQRKQQRIAQETRRVEHHRSMTINRDFSLIACICLKTNISFAQYFLIYSITTKINGNNKILQTRGLSQSFLSKMLLLQSPPIDISERLPHLVPSQTLNDVVNKNVMVILYSG